MELSEKQLLELKKYSTISMLDYLEQSVKAAKELALNAKNKDDLEKADIYLEYAISNYKNYVAQLEPEKFFKNK